MGNQQHESEDLQAIYDIDGAIMRYQNRAGRPTTVDSKPGINIDDDSQEGPPRHFVAGRQGLKPPVQDGSVDQNNISKLNFSANQSQQNLTAGNNIALKGAAGGFNISGRQSVQPKPDAGYSEHTAGRVSHNNISASNNQNAQQQMIEDLDDGIKSERVSKEGSPENNVFAQAEEEFEEEHPGQIFAEDVEDQALESPEAQHHDSLLGGGEAEDNQANRSNVSSEKQPLNLSKNAPGNNGGVNNFYPPDEEEAEEGAEEDQEF